jgi:transcriptional regulator with XRE-family HTH domain
VINGAQIREARNLLHWKAETLAKRARLTVQTIQRAESVDDDPPVRIANLYAIQRALEDAGVEFTIGDAPNVRLKERSGL